MMHDVASLSRELRLGESTLRRLIRAGDLEAVRVGRRILIPPAAVRRLLRAGRAPRGRVTRSA